jgi:MFS family permease
MSSQSGRLMSDPNLAQARKASGAAFIGTTIEWYDFFAYATAAALVFGDLFFPNAGSNPMIGVLYAMATYAVGFFTRPLGAIVFGHLGDRLGRRSALVFTLVLMGAATFLIGVLPTYAQIGWMATLLLVVLRLLQGFAVGGEWGGAATLSVEHAPAHRRMFFGSFTQLGSPAGALLSTFAFYLVSLLGDDALQAWAWRLPFLVSVVLIGVGLVVRLRVEESPQFLALRATEESSGTTQAVPLKDIFASGKAALLAGVGALALATGGYYIIVTLLLSYGTETVGLESSFLLTGLTIAAAAEVVTLPFAGWAADRWGAKPVVNVGVVVSVVLIAPMFYTLDSGNVLVIYGLMALLRCVGQSCSYGPMAGVLAELFPARTRYTGASVAYQVAGMIFGGFSPIVGAAILAAMGGEPAGLVAFFIALCALTSISMIYVARLRVTEPAPAPAYHTTA